MDKRVIKEQFKAAWANESSCDYDEMCIADKFFRLGIELALSQQAEADKRAKTAWGKFQSMLGPDDPAKEQVTKARREAAQMALSFCEMEEFSAFPHTAKSHIKGLAKLILAAPQPAQVPNEHGKNRYGLDMSYFRNLFNRELNRPLTDFRPDELARVLARAARTADAAVLQESEFNQPAQVPEGWKLVPIEPTKAQVYSAEFPIDSVVSMRQSSQHEIARKAYRAMLSAAPQPQEGEA